MIVERPTHFHIEENGWDMNFHNHTVAFYSGPAVCSKLMALIQVSDRWESGQNFLQQLSGENKTAFFL